MKGNKGGKPSGPRTVADNCSYFENSRRRYTGFDLMAYVYGNLAFVSSNNLYDEIGLTPQEVAEFSKIRKVVDFAGRNVIALDKVHEPCLELQEGTIWVNSLDPKRQAEGPYRVDFHDMAMSTDGSKRKLDSLRNFSVSCHCPRGGYIRMCRPPIAERLANGDTRSYKDIPSPYIETDLCSHIVAGGDYFTAFHEMEGLKLFGLPEEGKYAIRRVVKDVIVHRTPPSRVNDAKLNTSYEKEYGLVTYVWGDIRQYARIPV